MKPIITFLFFSILSSIFGQEAGVWIHPNKGQWQDPILYKIELNCGEMFLEKDGFTYVLNDFKSQMSHNHIDNDKSLKFEPKIIRSQIIRSKFIGSTWKGVKTEKETSTHYRNYFQGNDQSKWVSNVKSFHCVQLNDFYSNIDLLVEGKESNLKYSFIVQPNTDISQIKYEIKGANTVKIDKEGNLHITNRFGEIIEQKPIAWTIINERKQYHKVNFHLENNTISFRFPEGFDKNQILVIDPSLTFSTFSGSTADNWGMTATPDNQSNLCAGGIVFNDGGIYPVTTGAFDTQINGGDSYVFGGPIPGFDIAISKYNKQGTDLVYATYIGGSSNEAPHSLVSAASGELYIMGVTSSPNFPITFGAYDETFNGGPQILENELFYNGADIFVSKLSADGKTMLGSTYIGGTGTDGVNSSDLNYNYGDPFRGEIIVGEKGNIYVSSTTQSVDFPTKNASQNSLNGEQDAVIFKLNSDLSAMAWSTYFGGSGVETGNSIQQSPSGDIYIAGGTNSSNLSFIIGDDLSYNGGTADGYLTRLNQQSGNIIGGTYMGFNEYDQAYFVQIDVNNDVYVFGQTESDWAISAGHYGTPNSGQFIRKYTQDLTTISWTTMIGAGTGNPEISPTAFLVSNCLDIYLSGWGGKINVSYSKKAKNSSTLGFSTTTDAFQKTTNGDNFYVAVLGNESTTLKYATFMGGLSSSYNHVDGGTSRFDKSGRIYHAVCGACGGDVAGFTTTAGVFSPQNKSKNCNLAAFKFELNNYIPTIGTTDSILCMPAPLICRNSISNGNAFLWDFGDGSTSRSLNPTHYYINPGTYFIKLIVTDTVNCNSKDSVFFQVKVKKFEVGIVTPPSKVCKNTPFQLEAFGGKKYFWSPENKVNNPILSQTIASIDQTTNFSVNVSDECGSETFNFTVSVFNSISSVSKDTSICIGGSAELFATGGASYKWIPGTYLNNATIQKPISNSTQTITYVVNIKTNDGCILIDSTKVTVFKTPPNPILSDTVYMCSGIPISIKASGAEKYSWSPNNKINTIIGNTITVNPTKDANYFCKFENACGFKNDSVFVDVMTIDIITGKDTIICPDNPTYLSASGGIKYNWYENSIFIDSTTSKIIVHPKVASIYTVIGTDKNGCKDTASFNVNLFPKPTIDAGPDRFAIFGEQIQLNSISNTAGNYVWSPSEYLTCTKCSDPIANPDKNFIYYLNFTDINGCKASDNVKIIFTGLLYLPNSFTPDGANKVFKAEGSNIKTFELSIYNRWGELVFISNSITEGWDGTYKGIKCQDGTYIWKIIYDDFYSPKKELIGHVNLLR